MIFNKTYQRLTCSIVRSVNGKEETNVEIDVRAVPAAHPDANYYGSWVELTDHFGEKVSHMLREWDPKLGICSPNFIQIMKVHHDLYKMGAFMPVGETHQDFAGVRTLSAAIGELEDGHYHTHDRTWHQIPIKNDVGDFVWELRLPDAIVTARRKSDGSCFVTEISYETINRHYKHPRNENFDPEEFSSLVEKVRYDSLGAEPITAVDIERIARKLHP